jgi:preprotein translocase subunit SecA
VISAAVARSTVEGKYPEDWDLEGLIAYGEQTFLPLEALTVEELQSLGSREAIRERLSEEAKSFWQAREEDFGGSDGMRNFERFILLRAVDAKWMEHLDAMDQMRQGIGLRAYGNSDPLVEYKFEAHNMFQEMITSVYEDVVRYLFKLRLVQEQQPAVRVRQVVENRGDEEAPAQPVRVKQTIGRNDPCPCGSGKKYKRCCGKDA